MTVHSYPSVFQLGHRCVEHIFDGPVSITEKVDGSQISFGVIDGALQVRSKGMQIIIGAHEGMFDKAIETITALEPKLHPGWVYRGEYLRVPHHNALVYERVPNNHIVLFDLDVGIESYVSHETLVAEAGVIGLEVVPELFYGVVTDKTMFKGLLENQSILGGTTIEGLVIKNYALFGGDKKVLMAKWVQSKFAEVNAEAQHRLAPNKKDIIDELIDTYRTEARWAKSVQHMRDAGTLQQAPQDIGPLMKEVQADVLKEEQDTIKEMLFKWAWPQIARAITHGLPEWYLETLAQGAFPDDTEKVC